MKSPNHCCKMLVRDIRHGAKSLSYGTYVTTLHIQNLPDISSLLQGYTDIIF